MPELSPLQKAFAGLDPSSAPSSHTRVWDSLYRDSFHPWDRQAPSLALADLLLQRTDLVPPAQDFDPRGSPLRSETGAVLRRTALVPGCGLGHDALLLASFGYDVWALDSSPMGIDLAKENEKAAEQKGLYKAQDGFDKGRVHWVVADFFADDWAQGAGTDGSGQFDLIFDYTFLCALPVDMRPQWAQRIASLIGSRSRLVCLEFPSGKPLSEPGPPWGVNPEVYEALLAAPGDPIQYDPSGDGSVVSIPSAKPRDDAIHRLSLIKPLRTHPAGTAENGTVRDFISVWSR
ncbi:hypothetical protein ACO1O0_002054 [Amphichorda felina]